jgi:hypothetical protein
LINNIQSFALSQWNSIRKTRSHANGWISGNSVCCHHRRERADTRGRGGFKPNGDGTINWHCFNCGYTANYTPGRHLNYKFRKLLEWMGVADNDIKRLTIEAFRVKELIGEPVRTDEEQVAIELEPRPLPPGSVELHDLGSFYLLDPDNAPHEFVHAVNYLESRRIHISSDSEGFYPFYLTSEYTANNMHKRIIVPFYWQGNIVGYTARAMEDNIQPKYYNMVDSNYVFNVDRQRADSKFVIVSEGPFDAMSIDGVAVLENEVNETRAEIIDRLGKEVIVVPHADRAGTKLVDSALEYNWNVSFPVWLETCGDINQAVVKYGKLFVLKSILEAVETSKLKIALRKKELEKR